MSDLAEVKKEIEKIAETTPLEQQPTKVAELKNKFPDIEEEELLRLLFKARELKADPPGNLAGLLDEIQKSYQKYVVYKTKSQ